MGKSNPTNKNPARTEVRFKDILDFIGIVLFGTMIFGNYLSKDVTEQEYTAYTATRIIQIIALSTIPIGLITCILLRQITSQEASNIVDVSGRLVVSYLVGIMSLIVGMIIPALTNWRIIPDIPKERVLFLSYILQDIFFIVPVIFASLELVWGSIIVSVIPLYLFSGFALGIAFPTLKRWKKRTNWTSLLD